MTNFYAFILTLISSASVSLLLCGAGAWLARSWITERLKNSIKYEYDQKLAALNSALKLQVDTQLTLAKAEVDRQAEKLRIASTSFSEVQKAAIARKLDSVDILWSGLLATRELIPPVMSFMDILTPDEFAGAKKSATFQTLLGKLDKDKLLQIAEDSKGKLERIRPYVGEYVWASFSTYQAIILRTMFLIYLGKEDSEKLNWHKDETLRRLISSALGADGLVRFDRAQIGKVGWVREEFERSILAAMDKVITGKDFSEASLRQAQLMEEQIRAANLSEQK